MSKPKGIALNALLARFVKPAPKALAKPKQRLTLNYTEARKAAK